MQMMDIHERMFRKYIKVSKGKENHPDPELIRKSGSFSFLYKHMNLYI